MEEEQRSKALAKLDLRSPEPPRQPPVMLIDAYNLLMRDLGRFMQVRVLHFCLCI